MPKQGEITLLDINSLMQIQDVSVELWPVYIESIRSKFDLKQDVDWDWVRSFE